MLKMIIHGAISGEEISCRGKDNKSTRHIPQMADDKLNDWRDNVIVTVICARSFGNLGQ